MVYSTCKEAYKCICTFSGWHHRMNNKAGGALSFYRLVPLLRREAELVTIAVEGRIGLKIDCSRNVFVDV